MTMSVQHYIRPVCVSNDDVCPTLY